MGNNRTKLEPTWIVKELRSKLEPRILLEDLPSSKLLRAGLEIPCHASHKLEFRTEWRKRNE